MKKKAHYDESVAQMVDATISSLKDDPLSGGFPRVSRRKGKKLLKKYVHEAPEAFSGAPIGW
jgi:hypothetical protein